LISAQKVGSSKLHLSSSSSSVRSSSPSPFPPITTSNNNSSQSVRREIDDSELVPATTGTNRNGNLAYNCSLCRGFLHYVSGRAYSCSRCCTYFTEVVKDEKAYLAMSPESSSAKEPLINCVCSGCWSHNVYLLGKARSDTVRCKCMDCKIIGLCRPSANPATNALLVRLDDLKQHTQSNPISKLVLDKLDDSTK
jgi:hypothetical protein